MRRSAEQISAKVREVLRRNIEHKLKLNPVKVRADFDATCFGERGTCALLLQFAARLQLQKTLLLPVMMALFIVWHVDGRMSQYSRGPQVSKPLKTRSWRPSTAPL